MASGCISRRVKLLAHVWMDREATERDEGRHSGMVSLTFKVGFLSVKPSWGHPHRYTQRCVFSVTVKLHHHSGKGVIGDRWLRPVTAISKADSRDTMCRALQPPCAGLCSPSPRTVHRLSSFSSSSPFWSAMLSQWHPLYPWGRVFRLQQVAHF